MDGVAWMTTWMTNDTITKQKLYVTMRVMVLKENTNYSLWRERIVVFFLVPISEHTLNISFARFDSFRIHLKPPISIFWCDKSCPFCCCFFQRQFTCHFSFLAVSFVCLFQSVGDIFKTSCSWWCVCPWKNVKIRFSFFPTRTKSTCSCWKVTCPG